MRPQLLCLLCLWWLMPALAQDVPTPDPNSNTTERQRIEASREQAMAGFNAEDVACYKRFAVSGCLKDVQSRRRALLASLRKQEALLNERELAQRAAEQRQRVAQKVLERQQQEADSSSGDGATRAAEKQQEQQEKQAVHAAKAQASGAGSAAKPSPTGPTPADQVNNRDSYARKQLDAEKKRQDIAKRLAEKTGKSAAPLPVSP